MPALELGLPCVSDSAVSVMLMGWVVLFNKVKASPFIWAGPEFRLYGF